MVHQAGRQPGPEHWGPLPLLSQLCFPTPQPWPWLWPWAAFLSLSTSGANVHVVDLDVDFMSVPYRLGVGVGHMLLSLLMSLAAGSVLDCQVADIHPTPTPPNSRQVAGQQPILSLVCWERELP